VQRVVTVAGDSVVGTRGGRVKGHVIEGKRVIGGPGEVGAAENGVGLGSGREKRSCGGEKALQTGEKSFTINGFCNKL
jgi:hypothetical protein